MALKWDSVAGDGVKYKVYRDGVIIGTTTDNYFNDKYFTTVNELLKKGCADETHEYFVKIGDTRSSSVNKGCDVSKIAYINFTRSSITANNISEYNGDSSQFNLVTKNDGWSGMYYINTTAEPQTIDYYQGNTVNTRYSTDSSAAYSGYGVVGIDKDENALIMSNIVAATKTGNLIHSNMYAKVTAFTDEAVANDDLSEYTFLINQKADNPEITSLNTPYWSVNVQARYAEIDGYVKAIDDNGSISHISANADGISYAPINDSRYRTYIYNAKAKFNNTALSHPANQGMSCNFILNTGKETSGDALLVRSVGIVRTEDYINEENDSTDIGLTVKNKANGVILSWNAVQDVTAYDVYRDGSKIATVNDTSYSDKYFETIEALKANNYSTPHLYYVKAGDETSTVVEGNADVELIKYIDFSSVDPTAGTIDSVNKGAHGISMAVQNSDWNQYFVNTTDDAEEYPDAGITTKYYTDSWGAYDGNGYVAVDPKEHSLLLSNIVCRQGSAQVKMTAYAKVKGFVDSELTDYTYIFTQKTNNDQIVCRVPVTSTDTRSWYDKITDMSVINSDGTKTTVDVSNNDETYVYTYKPIADNNYHTYIYNTKAQFDENSTKHLYQENIDANIRFTNGGESSGDSIMIRSFGVVRTADFIR